MGLAMRHKKDRECYPTPTGSLGIRPRGVLLLLVLLLVLVLTLPMASAVATTGATAAQPLRTPLTLAWQPAPFPWLYAANAKNTWAQAGLNPHLVEFTSGPSMFAALKSGDVDVAYMGLGAVPAAVGVAGSNLRVILSVEQVDHINGIVARNDSGIQTINDLKGKSIGVVPGSSSYVGLLAALSKAGLSQSDVRIVQLSPATILPAFQNHNVDAIAQWPPLALMAIAAGGHWIVSNYALGLRMPGVLVARGDWLAGHMSTAVRLIHAMDLASNVFSTQRRAVIAKSAATMGVPLSIATSLFANSTYPSPRVQATSRVYPALKTKSGNDLAAQLQHVADTLTKAGFITVPINARSLVDATPLNEYMKTIKKAPTKKK